MTRLRRSWLWSNHLRMRISVSRASPLLAIRCPGVLSEPWAQGCSTTQSRQPRGQEGARPPHGDLPAEIHYQQYLPYLGQSAKKIQYLVVHGELCGCPCNAGEERGRNSDLHPGEE